MSLAAWFVGALALQHMAYILQFGSIFDTPRSWVDARRSHPIWGKLSELIHCQTCTITQLSFWVWTLPLWLWGRLPFTELPEPIAFMAVWFGMSAISLAAWDIARLVGRGSNALVNRARRKK